MTTSSLFRYLNLQTEPVATPTLVNNTAGSQNTVGFSLILIF